MPMIPKNLENVIARDTAKEIKDVILREADYDDLSRSERRRLMRIIERLSAALARGSATNIVQEVMQGDVVTSVTVITPDPGRGAGRGKII